MNNAWKDMTARDALMRWDADEPVWTVEMGGLGPGYEQCIQLMMFELMRAMLDKPCTAEKGDAEAWQKYGEEIEETPAVKEIMSKLSPSGAQYMAALNLSNVITTRGYAWTMERAGEERLILVSKNFPTL